MLGIVDDSVPSCLQQGDGLHSPLLLGPGGSSMFCPSDRKTGELDWIHWSLKSYARHWEDNLLRLFPLRWAMCPESKARRPVCVMAIIYLARRSLLNPCCGLSPCPTISIQSMASTDNLCGHGKFEVYVQSH